MASTVRGRSASLSGTPASASYNRRKEGCDRHIVLALQPRHSVKAPHAVGQVPRMPQRTGQLRTLPQDVCSDFLSTSFPVHGKPHPPLSHGPHVLPTGVRQIWAQAPSPCSNQGHFYVLQIIGRTPGNSLSQQAPRASFPKHSINKQPTQHPSPQKTPKAVAL